MSNTVTNSIRVTGDQRLEIKDLFEKSKVPTRFGHAWDLNEYGTALLCDVMLGDGITVEDDAIVIRCESKNSPPLDAIQKMSKRHPGLTFLIQGVANSDLQRWLFKDGEGGLLDCVQGAYEGEGDEIDDDIDHDQGQFHTGFDLTTRELELLALHWPKVKVALDDFVGVFGSISRKDCSYACRRLEAISELLGEVSGTPITWTPPEATRDEATIAFHAREVETEGDERLS